MTKRALGLSLGDFAEAKDQLAKPEQDADIAWKRVTLLESQLSATLQKLVLEHNKRILLEEAIANLERKRP